MEDENRKQEIIENYETRVARFEKKSKRRRNILRDKIDINVIENIDEIFDEVEGGGACVTCYK